MEHINRAIPTSGHSPMYVMHKFFARKQADVIREYIKTYTKEGEIVLDPFCGSGVMIAEALRLGRKAIGVDINPVAIFITRNTIKHTEKDDILRIFQEIKDDIGEDINKLYLTTCRMCKNRKIPAICYTWQDGDLVDVRYDCPKHGRLISEISTKDLSLYKKIEDSEFEEFFDGSKKCKYWYPRNRLYYNDGTPFLKKERFESVDEMFTLRNLISLAKLHDRIEKIENKDIQESFKFAFSSLTHLASRMLPVRPTRPFSSGWTQQSYWYAPNYMESNVWNLFESAVLRRQGLIKAKEDLPIDFRFKQEVKNFPDLKKKNRDHFLLTESAIDALEELEENSVDYIITDPPYGESIQYAELLYMWGCWLKVMDRFNDIARGEIVVNRKRRKTVEEYQNMLYVAFRKIFKVLKPERYCTVTFHNPSLKYRNILFRSVIMAGFDFEKIIYQPPPRPSAKSLLQPFGSLNGDYFFRFKKPKTRSENGYKTVDQKRVETLILNIAKRIIAERGEPTSYTFIQNSIDPILYQELRKYGLVMDFQPESVKKILNEYVGTVFQLVDMKIGTKGETLLITKGWWFIDPSEHRLDIPLNKRVDEAITNLLMRERKVSFTRVLTEIYTRFQNALTPEELTIKEILKENANTVSNGKWEIKPFIREVKEKHEEMVYFLSHIGLKLGFKIDIAKDEYGKFYDGKRLGSILDLTKVNLDEYKTNQKKRIKSIDVIWHDGVNIKAIFEIEHSTSIVDAIIRGSNIKHNDVIRIMVIPNQREDLVHRRFSEPAMKAIMEDMDWEIITYKRLEKFYTENKKKKELDLDRFLSLKRQPLSKEQLEKKKETSLIDFV